MKKALYWITNAILLPLDYFASGLLWQLPGLTVSSRCGLALRGQKVRCAFLLRLLGRLLNALQTDHCDHAIANDLARLERTKKVLGS